MRRRKQQPCCQGDGGFPMLPPVEGHVVTDKMVERGLADED